MQILILSLVLDCVNVSMGAFYLFPDVHKLQKCGIFDGPNKTTVTAYIRQGK
jgi:hypothetical protein